MSLVVQLVLRNNLLESGRIDFSWRYDHATIEFHVSSGARIATTSQGFRGRAYEVCMIKGLNDNGPDP